MKHILFILPYLELGGTERQALSLIRHFQHTHRISLLAPAGKSLVLFTAENIHYFSFARLEQNPYQGIRDFYRNLQRIHAQQPIDLIHVHAAHELCLLVKLRFAKIPVIFTVHGYHGSSSQLSYQLAVWFANRFANAVIAVCQAEADLLLKLGLKPAKINLIYNGVSEPQPDQQDIANFQQQFLLDPSQQMIIGTAARLTPAKGLPYLITAFAQVFAQLPAQRDNLRLVIAGTGELEAELKQLAINLQVAEQVIFTGYTNHLPALMHLFHIFVLPSLQEAFSLAVIEAMAQRKPIIGTNVGGIVEQVIDGETGFIIPAANPEKLAEKLSIMVANFPLIQELGERSYQRYQQNFTTEIMLAKTAKLYARYV